MEGKVKYAIRSIWLKECQSYHGSSDIHTLRFTSTSVMLDNGDEVYVDEDDIRACYGRQKITSELIKQISNDLRGETIEYQKDVDGHYYLDGALGDYL